MAPKKKTKTGDTLNSRLALVMKSGKVTLGYKSTLKGTYFLFRLDHPIPTKMVQNVTDNQSLQRSALARPSWS